ncbi:MAG TPA: hypothetical protein VIF62_23310 [Labilithrix sp.]
MDFEVLSQVASATSAGAVACVAAPATLAAFAVASRRARWSIAVGVPRDGGPYRSTIGDLVAYASPPLVARAAALGCMAFGAFFTPILVLALVRFQLDGIAASFALGVPLSLASVACGWHVIGNGNERMMRTLAHGSLFLSGALFVLAGLHLGLAPHPHTDGVELSVVGVAFAIAATANAALLLFAARSITRAVENAAARPRS